MADQNQGAGGGPGDSPVKFTGEEGGGDRSTPHKDLLASAVVAAIGAGAFGMSLQWTAPGNFLTSPGLLPGLTGLSLIAMAAGLALKAVRRGAAVDMGARARAAWDKFRSNTEDRRTVGLMVVIVMYVIAVGVINFSFRTPAFGTYIAFGSFEVISIIVLAGVLRFFWRAPLWKCALVAAIAVPVLGGAFRYGFSIPLPGFS